MRRKAKRMEGNFSYFHRGEGVENGIFRREKAGKDEIDCGNHPKSQNTGDPRWRTDEAGQIDRQRGRR